MNGAELNDTARVRIATYWALGLGLIMAYALLRGLNWQGGAHLHTLMEAVATVLALIVGVMALVRHYSRNDSTILIIGVAFLGTAFLDGYHTVVTSASFQDSFLSTLHSLAPWSWVASRLFLSVMLFASWVVWWRDRKLDRNNSIGERAVYMLTCGFTLASFIFFAFAPLPRLYYPDFLFHRPEEFVPALFFLMALYGYLSKGAWRRDDLEHWLVLSLIVGLISQTAFMSFSGQLFDLEFDAAHALKKVSYVCVLTGLLINMYAIFRREAESVISLELEVAARKRVEKHLTGKINELARSNEELEQFASIAAHDLQEPLRKVQAFSDRLRDKYTDVLDDQGKDYLDRMQNSARRMQTLIGDLLSYSRVTTKGKPFAPVDLNQVARGVISDLEIRIQETDAKIEFNDMPTIDADPSQMRQLFQNLIGNALKYCRDNITPLVNVNVQILDPASGPGGGLPENMCTITVKDNGIGFEEEYAERIFGIFQRLHGREKYEGAGVGLAICRKISERHGGTIVGKGRPNEGAEFVVTLPLRHAHN